MFEVKTYQKKIFFYMFEVKTYQKNFFFDMFWL